jgi:two-component system chemotaxis response regulator CheB
MNVRNVIVIGSSAGGPRILKEVFAELPFLDACILLVQHMPKFVNEPLTEALDEITKMNVKVASNGDILENGKVFVAPSELHMKLIDNRIINLSSGEKINYVCPSIDVTMKSLTNSIGIQIVGVILTGMGKDGAEGIKHIHEIGGKTIAQDEETCIIYGMPREAIHTGTIDWVLNPSEIQKKFIELVGVC